MGVQFAPLAPMWNRHCLRRGGQAELARVTTHLEKSGNSKVVREKSGSEIRCVFSSSKYSRVPIPIRAPRQFMKLSNVKISSRVISLSAM